MTTRVGIAELKAHLSEYVARAKAGERIVVCDRNTPVAELGATEERAPLPITQPTRSWPELAATLKPVKLNFPVDVVALLREDRDKR
ncbi:MAG: type II toxin-antitoxin system prevent-host-death family antitoxin [Anaerolinea sp.]|nr:type II toxin-antitoxin system prevent-host-death family antitoxin [Anaerolinea sp.]